MHKVLPIPEHFDPESVQEIWRVEYQQRAEEAAKWAKTYDIPPAEQDQQRVCLLLIDCQNTFCIPGFELFVGGRSGRGAVDDNVRICRFIYRNLPRITRIIATLDTHVATQIFHSNFFVNQQGEHPPPFTEIHLADVRQKRWMVDLEGVSAVVNNAQEDSECGAVQRSQLNEYAEHYCGELDRRGKYALTVWPYHAMLGGVGHALVAAVEEACFFHNLSRRSQTEFVVKGEHRLTENYSAISPEIVSDQHGRPVGRKNERLVQELLSYDRIIIAGQAKSHCVAWTVADLLEEIQMIDGSLAKRITLLDDCSSAVVVPGAADFTEPAAEAYAKFGEAGMEVRPSTEVFA